MTQTEPSYLTKLKQEILSTPIDPQEFVVALATDIDIKRTYYKSKKFYTLTDIQPLAINGILSKMAVWHGDMTTLEIDAIVNSANEGLLGGGGIDEAVHNGAGPLLQRECATLPLCPTGEARITKGYRLPAKYVIHTVGPYFDDNNKTQPHLLENCYRNSLLLCKKNNIRTVLFPEISTGFYGFPKHEAAKIAVKTVRDFLLDKNNLQAIDLVVFNVYNNADLKYYTDAIQEL